MDRAILSRLAFASLLLAFAAPGLAPARAQASVWAEETGSAGPPRGYTEFCQAHPQECVAQGSAAPETLTEARWRELVEINTAANTRILPLSDLDQYRVEEIWALPGLFGDCEDYALLKRKWLIEQGWPTSAVLITVVFDEIGDGHAVLMARTDRGDFVLDNKTDEIRLWSDIPYRFVKRQSVSDPRLWVRIGPSGHQDVATAAPPVKALMWGLLRGGFGSGK